MQIIKDENGFTLIEILVGINLSLLAVTFLFSFYLFAIKFISATTTKLDEKENISNFLFLFNNSLKKSNQYYFKSTGKEQFFVIDNRDTVSFQSSELQINSLYEIDKVDSYSLTINTIEQTKIILIDGVIKSLPDDINIQEGINSTMINEIEFDFSRKNKNYNFVYINNEYGDKRFKNISN